MKKNTRTKKKKKKLKEDRSLIFHDIHIPHFDHCFTLHISTIIYHTQKLHLLTYFLDKIRE